MAKYNLTKKAVEDLAVIWDYTFEEWSEKQADTYYDMLIANCKRIAENPSLGKNYKGVVDNLFGLRTNTHIIFYRQIAKNEIEVTRILHERMDLENRIRE